MEANTRSLTALELIAAKLDGVKTEVNDLSTNVKDDLVGAVDDTLQEEAPIVSQALSSSTNAISAMFEKPEPVSDTDPVIISTKQSNDVIALNTDDHSVLLNDILDATHKTTDAIVGLSNNDITPNKIIPSGDKSSNKILSSATEKVNSITSGFKDFGVNAISGAVGATKNAIGVEAPIIERMFSTAVSLVPAIIKKEKTADEHVLNPRRRLSSFEKRERSFSVKTQKDNTNSIVSNNEILSQKSSSDIITRLTDNSIEFGEDQDDIIESMDEQSSILTDVKDAVNNVGDLILGNRPSEEDIRDARQQANKPIDNDIEKIEDDKPLSLFEKLKENLVLTAGGLLRGIGGIFVAIKSVASFLAARVLMIVGFVLGIVNSIKKLFEVWGDDDMSLSEKIYAVIGAFIEGFTFGMLNGDMVAGVLAKIGHFIEAIYTAVIEPILDYFISHVKSFFGELFDDLYQMLYSIGDYISGVYNGVVSTIHEYINGVISDVKSVLAEGISMITNVVESLINSVTKAFDDVKQYVVDIFSGEKTITDVIWDILKLPITYFEYWFDLIKDILDVTGISDYIEPIFNDIKDSLFGLLDKFGELVAGFVDGIFGEGTVASISTTANEGIDSLGNLLNSIFGRFNDIWNAYQDDGIIGAIKAAVGMIKGDTTAKLVDTTDTTPKFDDNIERSLSHGDKQPIEKTYSIERVDNSATNVANDPTFNGDNITDKDAIFNSSNLMQVESIPRLLPSDVINESVNNDMTSSNTDSAATTINSSNANITNANNHYTIRSLSADNTNKRSVFDAFRMTG